MRKVFALLAVIAFSSPVVSHAQSFGLKGGLNMADFGGDRIVTSDHRVGFTIGTYAIIPITNKIGVQPEIYFSQKGAGGASYLYDDLPADTDGPPIGVYLNGNTSHRYVEVPLLLKFSPAAPGDDIRPHFFAGPSVGFLIGARKVHDIDYTEHLNPTDFGLVLGGGADFGKFVLDARYSFSLAAVAKDYHASYGTVPGGITNRAFTIMAGFRIF